MGNSNGNSLIPPIYVGGKVFDKIFGSNTIDIKLQGSADVTFGVKYQRRRDPSLTVAQQRTTNFDFNENIQLSASAKIGEKIQFKMSYNTKTQFSFENKFKRHMNIPSHINMYHYNNNDFYGIYGLPLIKDNTINFFNLNL